ncbi:MAG: glycosyltransferase family 4 protein [Candidatus Aenigmarchaeota archaeon]|nr:glycosyltransferase family 4 protein [Candidatus Aenigmarchaeota archaeon]
MKVAYLALSEKYGDPHAGFVHAYEMASNIRREGVEVKLFMQGHAKPAKAGLEVVLVEPGKSLGMNRYSAQKKAIMSELRDCEIIHERFQVNPFTLGLIGGRKYVLEINDPGIVGGLIKSRVYSYLTRKKLSKADAIITQTGTLKSILKKMTRKPIFVVSNGVNTNKFRPGIKSGIREQLGVRKDDILVTYAGSFREWHGVNQIPGIAKHILQKNENVKFLLIGRGDLFDETEALCRGEGRIIFAGARNYEDIPAYLSASDILIAPFDASGHRQLQKYGFWWCPVKLFEYMASGRAVVSYGFREVRNIVKGGGLLAKPGDIDDFANKLLLLVNNRGERERMGERGRKIAESSYDWRRMADRVVEIYDSAIAR